MDSSITVGILCMDTSEKLFEKHGPQVKSYIQESYVKFFLQIPDVVVVPIFIGREDSYYEEILTKINGVVFPGGAVHFDPAKIEKPEQTNFCVPATGVIFRIACEMNERGVFFPILAICLGYDLMLYHCAKEQDPRRPCTPLRKSMVLEFKEDYRESRMFKDAPCDEKSHPCVVHNHMFCVPEEVLSKYGIADQWTVTAFNKDDKGQEFISALEHKEFPYYGLQFHPEREDTDTCTTYRKHFAEFFVSECRKNFNGFSCPKDREQHLIENFQFNDEDRCYLF